MNGRGSLGKKTVPQEALEDKSASSCGSVSGRWRLSDEVILNIACAYSTFRQRCGVSGERWPVPRTPCEARILTGALKPGGRNDLTGVLEGVPLGTKHKYSAFEEDELSQDGDSKHCVYEDS